MSKAQGQLGQLKQNFFIVTRHAKLIQILQKMGGKPIDDINNISNSIIIGVLPIDLIAKATSQGNTFINVAIDPEKYERTFGESYNPKTAESVLDKLPDEAYIKLLRLLMYRSVKITEVSVEDVKKEVTNKKAIYYVGTKVFADGLAKVFGKPIVSTFSDDVIAFSPIEAGEYFYLRVTRRDLVIKDATEFEKYLNEGVIKIFKVNADVKPISWDDMLKILNEKEWEEWTKECGSLEGYSPDFYYCLMKAKERGEECLIAKAYCEQVYG